MMWDIIDKLLVVIIVGVTALCMGVRAYRSVFVRQNGGCSSCSGCPASSNCGASKVRSKVLGLKIFQNRRNARF